MDENKSYIEQISEAEIEQLADDYEMEKQGYSFHFIIDSYDLIRFAFPFIQYKDHSKRIEEKDLELDGLSAYQYLFFEYPNKPILPDEYLAEILVFRKNLTNNIQRIDVIFDSINEIISKAINNLQEVNSEGILNALRDNIKIITAFLSGGYTKNAIEHFDEILSDRLLVDTFEDKNISESKRINSVFRDTDTSSLTQYIFDFFYDLIRKKLEQRSDENIQKYLIGIIRDARVIDRIITVNKKLSEEGIKHVFLYVSSTPLRSPSIFENLKRNKKLPHIGAFKNYNILRNEKEIYLRFLLDNFSSDYEERKVQINRLLIAARLASKAKDQMESLGFVSDKLRVRMDQMNQMSNIAREKVEENLLIRRLEKTKEEFTTYQSFKKRLLSNISTTSSADQKEDLINLIGQLFELFERQNLKNLASSSTTLLKITHALNYELSLLLSPGHFERVSHGSDAIVGAFHHFPSLLFYKYKVGTSLFSLINTISLFYSTPSKKELDEDEFSWASQVSLFTNKEEVLKYRDEEITLAKLFLLLLSERGLPESPKKKEQIIYDTITDIIFISASMTDLGGDVLEIDPLVHEIYYFAVWVCRRYGDYENSVSYANKGLDIFPDSPRLLQGKGLTRLSQYYANITKQSFLDKKTNNALLKNAISHFNDAIEKYKKEEGETKENHPSKLLIRKNMIAINNSLADAYFRKHLISSDLKELKTARTYIDGVKRDCESLGLEYRLYQNYLHTEADIEIWETRHLLKIGELEKAKTKSRHANARYVDIDRGYFNEASLELLKITEKELRRINREIEKLEDF